MRAAAVDREADPRLDRKVSHSDFYVRLSGRCDRCRAPIVRWVKLLRITQTREYRLCAACTAKALRPRVRQ